MEIDRSSDDHPCGGARLAALVDDEQDLSRWIPPQAARRMSPPSKLAVAAARMALEAAGLPDAVAVPTGVVLATTFGPSSFTERVFQSLTIEGPESASAFLAAECTANAPAGQVAIHCGATGPNLTFVQGEAGPLVALARGAAIVASGRAERVLVGAVDEMTPLVHGVLDRFGALARASSRGPERPRPFDRGRNGFLAAEGATVLVLECEAAALDRGARVLAYVAGSGCAFDPSASRVGWGRGAATLARALQRTLARAGRAAGDVDRIVSGANGSVAGDRIEAQVLRCVWPGTALPPVLAPKAVTGEYGGGFLAAAVLAMGATVDLGPRPDPCEPDPRLAVVPHAGGRLPQPRCVLTTTLAAGGAAAWVLLEAA
jgi:3-oxoacyl-[acyl-carrier-protein] synthase II